MPWLPPTQPRRSDTAGVGRGVRARAVGRRATAGERFLRPADPPSTEELSRPMDVSFLEPVLAAAGPYATVCADVTHTTESAAAQLDLRARSVADQLTQQGAPDPVVEVVRARLLEGNDG